MDIQWYPGHMTKAKRQMAEDIKLIDLIIELVDARAPLSSRNPDIDELGRNKARLVLLNKADLADEKANKLWAEKFSAGNVKVLAADSRSRSFVKQINGIILDACREKLERDKKRGIKNRPIRAMVAGIPNVGKSTFINSFAGRASAKTGNKPGVTKGKQWIKVGKMLELLDTPGIPWPKFEDETVGRNLAFIGSVKDEVLNTEELSLLFLDFCVKNYPGKLYERYGTDESLPAHEMLYAIGEKRGCLGKNGEISYEKAANAVLDDFRSGKLGRITLELPENN